MSGRVTLETLSLRDLLEGRIQGEWNNPDRLALMTPEKRQAFATNPQATDHSLPAQIVAFCDRRVIGSIDLLQGKLIQGDHEHTILWGSNLFVHPDFRHVAAGIALLMQMQRCFPVVGVVGVSKMVHGVYQGLKWKETPMPRMVFPFRSAQILRSLLKHDLLGSIGAWFADPCLAIKRAALENEQYSTLQGFSVTVSNEVPTAVANIVGQEQPCLRPLHSVERMNWLLGNSFDHDPTRKSSFVLVQDGDGKPVGYAMVRQRFFASASQREIKDITFASVVDWGVDPASGLTETDVALLGALHSRSLGADAVEVPTSSKKLANDLASLGFRQIGELSVFLRASKGTELQGQGFGDDASLRPSDGDNYFA